jgi:hypothetical protein
MISGQFGAGGRLNLRCKKVVNARWKTPYKHHLSYFNQTLTVDKNSGTALL